MNYLTLRCQIEEKEEWRKWREEIPYIKFPADWEIKAIPPLAGAIVRYSIKTPKSSYVSVYLDCYDRLGYVGEPYWEVYPIKGDYERCLMNEVDKLLELIA